MMTISYNICAGSRYVIIEKHLYWVPKSRKDASQKNVLAKVTKTNLKINFGYPC